MKSEDRDFLGNKMVVGTAIRKVVHKTKPILEDLAGSVTFSSWILPAPSKDAYKKVEAYMNDRKAMQTAIDKFLKEINSNESTKES
jgi:hypothetical protein